MMNTLHLLLAVLLLAEPISGEACLRLKLECRKLHGECRQMSCDSNEYSVPNICGGRQPCCVWMHQANLSSRTKRRIILP